MLVCLALQVARTWRGASSDYGNTGMGLRTDHGGKLCRQAVTEEQRTCSSGGGRHPAQKPRGVGPFFSATAHALGVALLIVLVTPGTFGFRVHIPLFLFSYLFYYSLPALPLQEIRKIAASRKSTIYTSTTLVYKTLFHVNVPHTPMFTKRA